MSKKQKVYTPQFRRQMVELHRVGRGFDELAKEFGVTSCQRQLNPDPF